MNKQDIIDYIMDSPENTNPAILNQMIDEVSGGGSNNIFIIKITKNDNDKQVSNKTWAEIIDALNQEKIVYYIYDWNDEYNDVDYGFINSSSYSEDGDNLYTVNLSSGTVLSTESKNGYPTEL